MVTQQGLSRTEVTAVIGMSRVQLLALLGDSWQVRFPCCASVPLFNRPRVCGFWVS
jgi:hypothetical protein